jgi:hypothetical protein
MRVVVPVMVLGLVVGSPVASAAVPAGCGPTLGVVPSVDPSSGNDQLLAVAALGPNDVWVGGTANGVGLLERWNGTAWNVATPATLSGFVYGIDGVSSSDVWAVSAGGGPAMWHWNGSSWSSESVPLPAGARVGHLFDVAVRASNDVWAVGQVAGRTLVEHWNGAGWTRIPSPNAPKGWASQLRGVTAVAPDDVWAVGSAYAGEDEQPLIERWNGSGWAIVPSPAFPAGENVLLSVSAAAPDDVWAVGLARSSGPFFGVVEHWNGTAWALVRSVPGAFFGVRAIAPGDVWVVGQDETGARADHFDGTGWTTVRGPLVGGPAGQGFAAIDRAPQGSLWIAGDRPTSGGNRTLVERICPVQVSVGGFQPAAASAPLGRSVVWEVPMSATGSHSITEASAIRLFDSGLRAPGGSYVETLSTAGTYVVADTATSLTSRVSIRPVVPAVGTVGVPLTVTWADPAPPGGFVVDVQVRVAGSTVWQSWKRGATTASGTYTPAAPGPVSFRARLREVGIGSVAFSPASTVSVD